MRSGRRARQTVSIDVDLEDVLEDALEYATLDELKNEMASRYEDGDTGIDPPEWRALRAALDAGDLAEARDAFASLDRATITDASRVPALARAIVDGTHPFLSLADAAKAHKDA